MPFGRSGRTLTRTPKFPIVIYNYRRSPVNLQHNHRETTSHELELVEASNSELLGPVLAKQNTGSTRVSLSDEIALQSVFALRAADRRPVQEIGGEGMAMLLNVCIRPGTPSAT